MKYAIRVATVLAAVASLAAVGTPSRAASVTELAVNGYIQVSQGMQDGATILVNGGCAGAEASSQPAAGAHTCNLGTSGTFKGDCVSWSANVSGTIVQSLNVGGATPYDVNLTVAWAQGVLAITGTAIDAAGNAKTVAGGGVSHFDPASGSQCGNGPHLSFWTGSLTLAG